MPWRGSLDAVDRIVCSRLHSRQTKRTWTAAGLTPSAYGNRRTLFRQTSCPQSPTCGHGPPRASNTYFELVNPKCLIRSSQGHAGPEETWAKNDPKSGHAALKREVAPEQRGQESPCTTWPGVRDYPWGSCPGSTDRALEKPGQTPELPKEGLCFQAYVWNVNYSHQ